MKQTLHHNSYNKDTAMSWDQGFYLLTNAVTQCSI